MLAATAVQPKVSDISSAATVWGNVMGQSTTDQSPPPQTMTLATFSGVVDACRHGSTARTPCLAQKNSTAVAVREASSPRNADTNTNSPIGIPSSKTAKTIGCVSAPADSNQTEADAMRLGTVNTAYQG